MFHIFRKLYLKFKAAKTAIVGVMTTPRLTCQFHNIVTSYCHLIVNHLGQSPVIEIKCDQ